MNHVKSLKCSFKNVNHLVIRFTGFASRFYFYPENFAIPEEQNKDYFGELKRQVRGQRSTASSELVALGRQGAPPLQPEERGRVLPAEDWAG